MLLHIYSNTAYILVCNTNIYAVLLDLFFRKFMIFPSLSGYYNYFNYFWCAAWVVIPILIPLALFTLLKYYKVIY
jgi:hypothetical protein